MTRWESSMTRWESFVENVKMGLFWVVMASIPVGLWATLWFAAGDFQANMILRHEWCEDAAFGNPWWVDRVGDNTWNCTITQTDGNVIQVRIPHV